MENIKRKQILFTAPGKAEYLETELSPCSDNEVLVKTEYTVVSGGTERACLMGSPNTVGKFPLGLGYCGVGYVTETGKSVKSVKAGDRVLVYHGQHASINKRGENEITKVENTAVSSLEAAFVIIASMGLGGVRKLEIEIGESAMVMGLGLLGLFSVQFARLNGAYPVIACDLYEERRKKALELGADYALDPSDADFCEKVKEITKGKGINACVEVTGNSKALLEALECASPLGRISLLGCTRVSDTAIDYYTQVHRPGVRLIGAHNFVRPKFESYPHHWTHHDDCRCILDLIEAGRIKVSPIVSRILRPEEAPAVYAQLADDPHFPAGTVFDWRGID